MHEIVQHQQSEQFHSNTQEDGSQPASRDEEQSHQSQRNRTGATGPRTELGKRRSSQNALKSGIFSQATLLKDEPRAEYQSLLGGLWESLQPEGKLEELLVEKLATISWRYRRLLLAEAAEIRTHTEFPRETNPQSQARMAEEYLSRRGPLISKIEDPNSFEECLKMLADLKKRINDRGFTENLDTGVLNLIYGKLDPVQTRKNLYSEYWNCFLTARAPEKEREREGYAKPEECKRRAI